MAENLIITSDDKESRYQELVPQIEALIAGETDVIANMANITAALAATFYWLWVGFYIVRDNQLVLAPFQGPIACSRIDYGRGVCGTAWATKETQLVPNVDLFAGHIACSSLAKSEIVIPLLDSNDNVWAVLDVDSQNLATFDEIDARYLTQIIKLLMV